MWQIEYAKQLINEQKRLQYLYSKAILHYKNGNNWYEKLTYIRNPPNILENQYFINLHFIKSGLIHFWEYLNN